MRDACRYGVATLRDADTSRRFMFSLRRFAILLRAFFRRLRRRLITTLISSFCLSLAYYAFTMRLLMTLLICLILFAADTMRCCHMPRQRCCCAAMRVMPFC